MKDMFVLMCFLQHSNSYTFFLRLCGEQHYLLALFHNIQLYYVHLKSVPVFLYLFTLAVYLL